MTIPVLNLRSFRKALLIVCLTLCLPLLFPACAADPNPVRHRIVLPVGPAAFQTELAATEDQRETGLMFRTALTDTQGMLFIFEKDQHLNFWMKNTLIPLSIAYIASSGQIKEILDMVPQSLASVPSTWAVRYALEVPQGAFARAGVKVGDQVQLPPGL